MSNPVPPARGEEARDVLADVLADQKARAERREKATPKAKEQGPGQLFTALALAGLTAWVWIAPPSLVRPPPPPPLPAPVAEAELRLTVFQAVLAIEAHVERTSALPTSLLDVFEGPEDFDGLVYENLDAGRFRLTGVRGDRVVIYETGDSISALLGNARQVLESGR